MGLEDGATWAAVISEVVVLLGDKYPSARQIVLQPVAGGPGHALCEFEGEVIRAAEAHPLIDEAIAMVAEGVVIAGASPEVATCAGYFDQIGHLTLAGKAEVSRALGDFYASFDSPDDPVPQNGIPTANAGPDQEVSVAGLVQFDGSSSGDPDGDPLTFQWSLASVPNGSTTALEDPTTAQPSFVPDLPGAYIVQLVVNDGTDDSLPDQATITAVAASIYFPPDGGPWESVDPASVGWDAEKLSATLDLAGDRNSSGVVILHNGRMMAERYWPLVDPPTEYLNFLQGENSEGRAIEDVASVQKSVAAVLVGVAQERGVLQLDDPASTYLGPGWSSATQQQEEAITVRHLLTMTSGLANDLSFEAGPGLEWRYNTLAFHYVMRIVEAASGQDRNAFTPEWLTSELGMEDSSWTPRPWDEPGKDWGFSTTARDLARFGIMIQAGGRWNDQVIVEDGEYFEDMLSPSQSLNPRYGYLWWLNGEGSLIPSAPDDLVAALGGRARKLYVVPSLGLVIARLGDSAGAGFNEDFWQSLMEARN